jgi:nucleotide-binding universal stress UspA family protein
MIFKSILTPIDGSAPSNAAITLALALAKDTGAQLVFCHAVHIPRPAHDAGGFAREQIMEEGKKAAHEILEAARTRAADAGVEATAVMIGDPVADAILDCAKKHGSDIIVMGTHGHGGIRRALLGSKTAEVINRASVPVMVAPHVSS